MVHLVAKRVFLCIFHVPEGSLVLKADYLSS